MLEYLMIVAEEFGVEQSVELGLHADWLQSLEFESLVDFHNWGRVRFLFVSNGPQELRVEALGDMSPDHLIPGLLFGGDSI